VTTAILDARRRPLSNEVVDDTTRREFILGGVAAGLLIASGCGSNGEDEDAASPSTTAAPADFPVTIEHTFGTTNIPAEPKRVLSLGFNEHDAILALGVKPIAVRYWFGSESDVIFPWAEDEFASAQGPVSNPEILNMLSTELNFEKIAALEPDLISGLYSGMKEGDYAKLSQIAPTIARTDQHVDYGTPWQEVTRTIGRALGRAERADEMVADVEAQFAAARQQHPGFAGKTVAVAYNAGDGMYFFNASQDGRARIFTQLGFEVPEELDELAGEKFFGKISGEQLNLLDRDVLVWLLPEGEDRADIDENPLFQQLEVIQQKRTVFIGGELNDALNFATALSLPFLLDGVVPMLAAAADGDPTTVASPS